jgi:hypothetical protein
MAVMKRTWAVLLAGVLVAGSAVAREDEPPPDPSELLDALLIGLGGFRELTAAELEQEVADIGGVPFRSSVTFEYLDRPALSRYVRELLEDEYGEADARADERTLGALGLLPAGTDLRAVRARLLEENVAGFYDVRPGRKRLYAISGQRRLTPANQVVLAHELRHALQDQYLEVHSMLPDEVGDFDDRSLSLLCLLEGDALLVMERFLMNRLGGGESPFDTSGFSLPATALGSAPAILRDQLVMPYSLGRSFVAAAHARGGWPAVRAAWDAPPKSSEQVLHPEKYEAREAPREVDPGRGPASGRVIADGVLGEAFIGTLLGGESPAAAAGWGGDRYRTWDVGGKTLLSWRSVWDTEQDAREFREALAATLAARGKARPDRRGFRMVEAPPWTVAWRAEPDGSIQLFSSDDARVLEAALRGRGNASR